MELTKTQREINVSVDTGKQQLDIFIRPLDIFFTVSNDFKGISKAITELKKHNPARIIIEATGRLEHVRRFAAVIGQLAKTDKLDAALIAHFGEAIKPELSQLKPEKI